MNYPDFPDLTEDDFVVLNEIMNKFPAEFNSNRTDFFMSELDRYCKEARVFRISIMGETRGGKSETAHTIAFMYIRSFNKYFKQGKYNQIILNRKPKKISYKIDNVKGSQTEYLSDIRNIGISEKLQFGQIWLIDEDKKKIGGLGSHSEQIELGNINNISAKFMQSEIWIRPDRFLTRNAPYGLYVYKKDLKHKINWSLLYKISMTPSGSFEVKFLGWVCIPLHPYEKFRKEYEKKKNSWINDEFSGKVDVRTSNRNDISKKYMKSSVFEMNEKGRFVFSTAEQSAYISQLIVDGKIPNFNEAEKYEILNTIRLFKKMEFRGEII